MNVLQIIFAIILSSILSISHCCAIEISQGETVGADHYQGLDEIIDENVTKWIDDMKFRFANLQKEYSAVTLENKDLKDEVKLLTRSVDIRMVKQAEYLSTNAYYVKSIQELMDLASEIDNSVKDWGLPSIFPLSWDEMKDARPLLVVKGTLESLARSLNSIRHHLSAEKIENARKIDKVTEFYAEEIKVLISNHTNATELLKSDCDDAIQKQKSDQDILIAKKEFQYNDEIKELKAGRDTKIAQLNSDHRGAIEKLNSDLNIAIVQLEKAKEVHDIAMHKLNSTHEDAIDKLNEELRNEVARCSSHADEMKTLTDAHDEAIKKIQGEAHRPVCELTSDHRDALDRLRSLEDELEQTKADYMVRDYELKRCLNRKDRRSAK